MLEFNRTLISERRVHSFGIVDILDEPLYVFQRFLEIFVFVQVHLLVFQRLEKALHKRVVVRISLPAVADLYSVVTQTLREGDRRVLQAPIRMMDEPSQIIVPPVIERHLKSFQCRSRVQITTEGPADAPSGIDVQFHSQEDELLFSQWIEQAYERLSHFYMKKISREEKLKGREEVFKSLKEEFKDFKNHFQTDDYKDFEKIDMNNAVLLAYRRYIHRQKQFETLYEHLGRDLKRVVEFLKMIRASGDKAALASFIE